jgi:hypothetical protein
MSVDDHGRAGDERDEALGGISPDVEPPPDLRDRVLGRLRTSGLVHPAGRVGAPGRGGLRAPLGWVLAAAAVALAFLGGRASVGEPRAGDGAGESPGGVAIPARSWALLLYEDARFDAGGRTPEELVGLYGDWAERTRDEGRLVLAEKLADSEAVLFDGSATRRPGGAPPPGILTGLFLVTARGLDEALDLARATPHHRFRGTVVVRAIDPT